MSSAGSAIYPLTGEFCLKLLEYRRVCFVKVIELEHVCSSTDSLRFLQRTRNSCCELKSPHQVMLVQLETTERRQYAAHKVDVPICDGRTPGSLQTRHNTMLGRCLHPSRD